MSHSNSKQVNVQVGEIFTAAGAAFSKLAEIIMTLHPIEGTSSSGASAKGPAKRKSTDEPAMHVKKQVASTATLKSVSQDKVKATNAVISQTANKSANMTLNMLNAMEPEVDVEGLTNKLDKLDYDSSDAS